ncbi:invasion-like protein [Phyllobacterium phragmitis]|uniref:Invasion-like protein n=2 Tax=Phyllobacterium phragmitis TaxID=2670329 RepID=A0A2S9ILA9_9HYPH|nr:invasion-like protein [Phyllobacterium phragmitis]
MMVVAALTVPAPAQEVSLPGGASTLNETHGAWTVTCAIATQGDGERAKRCALSQTQLHGQTRQRALAIELLPEEDGVDGTLVLPFGLALASGVTYQLDEGEAGAPQHFRTCLPAGCLIDIAFDARTVASLKTGDVLKVKATADGGQEMVLSISLTGFSSAYDRVVALTP